VPVDVTRPSLDLSGPTHPKLGKGKLRLTVSCPSEPCSVRVSGLLRIKGRKASKTKRVTRTLGAGDQATLTIRLSARQRRAAAKALKADKAVSVRFTVTATDAAGNRTTRHLTVRPR
jgi:hypothetical protein